MYSCKVGSNFKFGFFKRSLNFCYDKTKGIVYSNDLKTLEQLGIKKELISDAYFSSTEGQEISKLQKNYEELKIHQDQNIETINKLTKDVEKLLKDKQQLEKTLKDIIDFQQDIIIQEEDKDTQRIEIESVLKNSIGILNRKIKETNETLEETNLKFEAMIELLAEQASNSKQSVNIMSQGITVEKIWNSTKNKNDAAILSIMYMMKKSLEEKGTRF